MADMPIEILLGLAGSMVALAGGTGVFALQLQKQQKRVAVRIGSVASAYGRADAPEETHKSSRVQVEAQPLLHRIARIFGYDPAKVTHYKVKWWVVLPASFIVARGITELLVPLLGWIALAIVPPGGVLISRAFYKWCDNRRKRQLYTQFPDALAMIVRGVRVGIPVAESMRTVGQESSEPTAEEFRRVADRTAVGVPLDEALYEMAAHNDLSEYRFFATALALQSTTGGGLSETLESLADVIRKRVALRARGYALASEARSSIFILCSLPIVTGLAMYVINPDYISQLFTTDMGKKISGAVVISFSVGLTVMQLIVKKSLS